MDSNREEFSKKEKETARIKKEINMNAVKEEDYIIFNEYESLLRGFMFYQTQQVKFRSILLKKVIGILAIMGFIRKCSPTLLGHSSKF